jgi:hypothetical protein
MFNLIWEGEVIDTVDSREEAAYLAQEYKLAYGGGAITIEEADKDDGQPTMYEEYQDLYGGDDMFETCSFYDEY